MNQPQGKDHIVFIDECEINLKNRYLAATLAFLIPGAGHYYQGRHSKAYLFGLCILGLFFLGLFIGQGRVVYASWTPDDYRIQFPAQMCVGVPAFPAALQAMCNDGKGNASGNLAKSVLGDFMAAPKSRDELSKWHVDASAGFELGSLYTAVAGLLNLLAIFDAFAGPMPMPQSPERRKKKPDGSVPETSQ